MPTKCSRRKLKISDAKRCIKPRGLYFTIYTLITGHDETNMALNNGFILFV
jgi:hypothetical protein